MRLFFAVRAGLAVALVASALSAGVARAQSETEILRAQNRLLALGYELGEADGVYGPATRRAVRAFQADWKLEVNGAIGPELFERLAVGGASERPVEDREGCAVRVFDPRPEETVSWSGACVEGAPEGEGRLVRRFRLAGRFVEWRYEGALSAGEPSGRGVRVDPRGARYEGDWSRGQRHGAGEEVWPDGTRYTGGWRFDLFEGSGRLETPSGLTYEGGWEGGLRDGHGVETYANGDRYEGGFVYDARDGAGVYRRADGAIYEGRWEAGLPNGQGVLRLPGGEEAAGRWSKGCLRTETGLVAFLAASESCGG